MLIVGLTGSIGMGKSTAAARFRSHGIPVFDADGEVHRLYESELVPAIETAFPGTSEGGRVDRQKLSAALLRDPSGFKRLEAIVHPAVREAERRFLRRCKAQGVPMALLEVPLLFETGRQSLVDKVVVVSAGPEIQQTRVLARPGMTAAKLREILSRQTSDRDKRQAADYVVDTAGTIAECERQVDAILLKLEGLKGTAYEKFWA